MANVSSAVRARYEPLRSLLFSGISGVYAGVGLPFENPVRILKITNFTDKNILVSLNGVDNHDIVASNGFFLYDYSSNKSSSGGLLEQPQGDRIYVKAEAADNLPTIGTVYVTIVYASQV